MSTVHEFLAVSCLEASSTVPSVANIHSSLAGDAVLVAFPAPKTVVSIGLSPNIGHEHVTVPCPALLLPNTFALSTVVW